MPRLRRLSGKEVVRILENFGFAVIRIKGSHHRMERKVEGRSQFITVPVHGNKTLPNPTIQSIYREAGKFVPPAELRAYFYSD